MIIARICGTLVFRLFSGINSTMQAICFLNELGKLYFKWGEICFLQHEWAQQARHSTVWLAEPAPCCSPPRTARWMSGRGHGTLRVSHRWKTATRMSSLQSVAFSGKLYNRRVPHDCDVTKIHDALPRKPCSLGYCAGGHTPASKGTRQRPQSS